MSLCASFIFLSSKDVYVEDNSLVGFNATATGVAYMSQREDWALAADLQRKLKRATDFEKTFAAQQGIDERWLIESFLRLQHHCLVRQVDWDKGEAPNVYTFRKYGY